MSPSLKPKPPKGWELITTPGPTRRGDKFFCRPCKKWHPVIPGGFTTITENVTAFIRKQDVRKPIPLI